MVEAPSPTLISHAPSVFLKPGDDEGAYDFAKRSEHEGVVGFAMRA